MNFGFSLGFFVTPSAEIGFLRRRQATEMEISGTRTDIVGDWNIDGHACGAYYFGDPEGKPDPTSCSASARPTTARCPTSGWTVRRPARRAAPSFPAPLARA
ncbi:MAG: hypothetical protein MZV65_53145 [Chromatiales bacterium]|nr:hypothetical protein [Chromatiales bacterium]